MNRYDDDRTEWRNTRRDLNRGFRLGVGWWIAIVAIILVVGAAIWGITVATSGIRGQGDGIIQKNSAENWLDAQARFVENYAEYESTLVRIDQFAAVSAADPTDAVAKTNWLGQISHCTDVVADYNADSMNFLRQDFQNADLPYQLDPDTCTKTQETAQ